VSFEPSSFFHESLADIYPWLDHGNHCFQLVDGCCSGGLLGFLLRLLTGECRDLGTMLGHLVEQQLALRADERRVGIRGWPEVNQRIVSSGERRAQAGDIELLGEEVAMQVIALCGVYRGIEFYQHVAGFDRLSVVHPDGTHHPGLERLDDLGAAARHDFSGGRSNDVDGTPGGPGQRCTEQQDDDRHDGAPNRRGRRFDDLERGRQERQLFGAPLAHMPKRNDLSPRRRSFSGLHGYLPATDATMHNGRRSSSARHACRPRPGGRARS
jgi:hypothetical protein